MVEFAVVLPVLMLFGFGVIEFIASWTDANSLRSGVREGARAVIVGDVSAGGSCTIATSLTLNADTRGAVCTVKNRSDLRGADVRVSIFWTGGNTTGRPAIVCALYPFKSRTGLLSPILDGRAARTKVVMRIERPLTNLVPFSEDLPTGFDWSWCT
jgi:Flp pilus assembly protein TadG